MIHPGVLRQLEEVSDSEARCSFLLRFRMHTEPRVVHLPSKRKRLEALELHFQQVKAPVLARLAQEEGVSVVNLSASAEALVTASVARWRELTRPGGGLDTEPEVELLPNTVDVHALTPRDRA